MTNIEEQEWIDRIALKMTPGLGDITLRKLVDHYGSAGDVFNQNNGELRALRGISGKAVDAIISKGYHSPAVRQYHRLRKLGAELFFYTDKDFPVRLSHCCDGPSMLFYKGSSGLNGRRTLGIVGTRKATEEGKGITEKIVKGLVDYGVTIISGLAYGIDTQAHRSAINAQLPTVAVLGHGLDTIYPSQNAALARKMVENGGLVTEFFSNTIPDRENFPKRNRIIAGLCDGVVVVEAAKRGGALITAEIANSYNRDVFAVPGRWGDEYSMGCNRLIRSNKAALIQSAEDIIYVMGWDSRISAAKAQVNLFEQLPEKEQMIYSTLLKNGAAGIDWLSHLTKIKTGELTALLLKMEFDGLIRVLPGKMFVLS